MDTLSSSYLIYISHQVGSPILNKKLLSVYRYIGQSQEINMIIIKEKTRDFPWGILFEEMGSSIAFNKCNINAYLVITLL